MEEYLAIVKLFAGNFVPEYFHACDGSLLPIMQNQALFSLLGTTYGGDGQNTFALPKLEAPAEGLTFIICTQGIFPQRPSS
jgi:microcystin-dependent protein